MARTDLNRNRAFHNPDMNPDQTKLGIVSETADAAKEVRELTGVVVIPNEEIPEKEMSRDEIATVFQQWGITDEIAGPILELGRKGKVKIAMTFERWLEEQEPIDTVQAAKIGTIMQIIEYFERCFSDVTDEASLQAEIKAWFEEPNKKLDGKSPLEYLGVKGNQKMGLMQISLTLMLEIMDSNK